MPDPLKNGDRVRITNPSYPDVDKVGTLLSTSLLAAAVGSYGTHTIVLEDGRTYRSEGVLSRAS
jgi:hypothetical protein